jgi:predicted phosphodiesterase
MRFAVLADIHGNLPALEAVLQDLAPLHPDKILVAGDHANAGPFPRETLAALQAANCELIRGNHEDYLVDYTSGRWPASMRASQQWAPVRWTCAQLSADEVARLAALPEQRILHPDHLPPIRMLHGSLRRANEGLVPQGNPIAAALFKEAGLVAEDHPLARPAQALAAIEESVLICGHTHIPWIEAWQGKLALNPGSVGAPLTGSPHAQYALLSWQAGGWQAELRAVPYDLARVRRAFLQGGLLEAAPGLGRACLANVETGLNVAWFFVLYAVRLARARGAAVEPSIPDPLWEEACRSFPWQTYEP